MLHGRQSALERATMGHSIGSSGERSVRKLLGVLAVAVGLFVVLPASSASADTPGCVTRGEFNQIRRGDSRQRVTNVFDIPGRVSSQFSSGGYASETRDYRPCTGRYSYVSVIFHKDPGTLFFVNGKYAYWG